MNKQDQPDVQVKEFNFKMDKAEKILSFGILILFFFSFTNQQSILLNIAFFGVSALIFIYYFAWYRKKPPYVVIKQDEVVINQLPFYKPRLIKREKIKKAVTSENKIVVKYEDDAGAPKEESIYLMFLDQKDQKSILEILKNSK